MNDWPLYRYSMDLLIDEETALSGQGRWYKGASDGSHWIYQAAKSLTFTYYRKD